jgi:hypothetical protein
MGGAGIETENAAFHPFAEACQPGLQGGFPFSGRQGFDATAEFADGDGAQVEVGLVIAQPLDNLVIWLGLGEFAEDIGVHEVAHKERAFVKSLARGGISNG